MLTCSGCFLNLLQLCLIEAKSAKSVFSDTVFARNAFVSGNSINKKLFSTI